MIWIIFLLFVFALLALDLGVFHKENKQVSLKSSIQWTIAWFALAMAFGGIIYYIYDQNLFGVNTLNQTPYKAMIQFYTGYFIEESLSLDNIFVIALIFSFFKINPKFQHNILFWGIIGAVFFRLLMIFLGTAFVQNFEWSMYVFGGILIYSAFKILFSKEESEDFKESFAIRLLGKIYPIDLSVQNGKYFIISEGKKKATALFAALIVVEFSDILFAVDSIPAIFSVTKDPFIVFTSNIFAILGLRNLFFFLAGMMDKFQYIKYSLVGILFFVGIKMIIAQWVEIESILSLLIILALLMGGILFSLLKKA